RFKIFPVERNRGSQEKTLWAGNRVDRAVIEPVDPWHGRPVIEAHHEFSLKSDASRSAEHDPHKIAAFGRSQEIDHRRGAGLGLEIGFEHQRPWTIAPARTEL